MIPEGFVRKTVDVPDALWVALEELRWRDGVTFPARMRAVSSLLIEDPELSARVVERARRLAIEREQELRAT